jgi:hypothetical protein
MLNMQYALARERMRESHQRAQQHRLANEVAAINRWHYLAERARVAQQRRAAKAAAAEQRVAVAPSPIAG